MMPWRARRAGFSPAMLGIALGAGCASHLVDAADREVADILAGKSAAVEAMRRERFVSPRPRSADPAAGTGASAGVFAEPDDGDAPHVEVPDIVSADDSLRIAFASSREFRSRRESLFLSALALTGTRFEFSPRFTSTLAYILSNASGGTKDGAGTADLGVSQILPLGGSVEVRGTAGVLDRGPAGAGGGATTNDAGVSVSLTQPLLRGFGREASHEALTQAERQVVYDVREFARFREQFVIDVLRRHYNLVAQQEVVVNTERQYERQRFHTRRTQALYQVGRQDQLEVLRADTELLRIESDLEDARQALDLARDQYKLFLGLPMRVPLRLDDAPPEFHDVDVSLDSAVEAALANRFDFANAREQLEDAERAHRIAAQGLLPDLALRASWSSDAGPTGRPFDWRFDAWSNSVGLTLSVPLQRTLERNAFRAASIALDRQRRAFREARDALVVEVRETHRNLRQAAVQIRIQERLIEGEERRARKAKLDFDAGTIGNRDLIEAEQSLLNARNARIRALVAYEIARIELERAMGTLDVRDDGTWVERRAVDRVAAGPGGEAE